jgi:hypothetical protein
MKIEKINNIIFSIFIALSVISLVSPATNMTIKAAILGIQSLFILYRFKVVKLKIVNKPQTISLLASLVISTLCLFIGLNNNFNPWVQFKIYFLWPILFTIVFATVTEYNLKRFMKSLVISTAIINIAIILAHILPESHSFTKWLIYSLRFKTATSHGNHEYFTRALASFFFLYPISIYTFFKFNHFSNTYKVINFVNIIITSILIVLSFRRALIIVSIFSPLTLIFLHYFVYKKSFITAKKALIFTGIIITGASLFYLVTPKSNFNKLAQSTIGSFNFLNKNLNDLKTNKNSINFDGTVRIRIKQAHALYTEWKKSPFFGRGLGSYNKDFLMEKKADQNHEYDLVYLDLLMKLGIFGLLAFSLITLYNYFVTYKHVLTLTNEIKDYYVALSSGSICLLIGNASNPYLLKFDAIWILFIPFCIQYLNQSELKKAHS